MREGLKEVEREGGGISEGKDRWMEKRKDEVKREDNQRKKKEENDSSK